MQGIEINYTLDDKLQITRELDKMKIDYVEGGFPLANDKEAAFFREVRKLSLQHTKIVAFGSTRRPNGSASSDPHILALLEAESPAVMVVGKSWRKHVHHVLRTGDDENLRMISDSISFLKRHGREVHFDLEHFFSGYADDPEYSVQVLRAATESGADSLILCDTVGGAMPHDVASVMANLPLTELAPIGGHFHNDCGVAVANSLEVVIGGGTQVQGTVNGWGERSGNADLCVLLPNLALKMGVPINSADQMRHITSLSRFVAEKANIIPDKRQPYVGVAAFSHKAGQHADVIAKAPDLMEHIDGTLVGNERQVLLSELAGKSSIVERLEAFGTFDKNDPVVGTLVDLIKNKESDGYEFEAADASVELLIRRAMGTFRPLVELRNYHLESFKTSTAQSKTVGRIYLSSRGEELMGAAVGVGPVETIDMALRDALVPHCGFLDQIVLTDYRVRVLNPESASAAKVRVFITCSDHEHSWTTVGVNENIVEASWEALIDAYEYYFNRYDGSDLASPDS